MVHVLSPAVVCGGTATVMLVIVASLVANLFVLATVTMVNVFSIPITLQNHVFVMTDILETIVKQNHEK